MPVAAEVARALEAPLDVLVVRKLGVPWDPELGFGAIGESGVTVVDEEVVAMARIRPSEMEDVIRAEGGGARAAGSPRTKEPGCSRRGIGYLLGPLAGGAVAQGFGFAVIGLVPAVAAAIVLVTYSTSQLSCASST